VSSGAPTRPDEPPGGGWRTSIRSWRSWSPGPAGREAPPPEDNAQELVIDEKRHSVARSSSPNPARPGRPPSRLSAVTASSRRRLTALVETPTGASWRPGRLVSLRQLGPVIGRLRARASAEHAHCRGPRRRGAPECHGGSVDALASRRRCAARRGPGLLGSWPRYPELRPSERPGLASRRFAERPFRSGLQDRPCEGGRVDASTPGTATGVRQVDSHPYATRRRRPLDELRLDAIEHQLRPPEHLEGVVRSDVSPRKIEESVATLAVNARSAKVERALVPYDIDVDLPASLGLVCSHQPSRVLPDLDAHVDVVHRGAVGTTEHAARQIDAGDRNSHSPMMPVPGVVRSQPAYPGAAANLGSITSQRRRGSRTAIGLPRRTSPPPTWRACLGRGRSGSRSHLEARHAAPCVGRNQQWRGRASWWMPLPSTGSSPSKARIGSGCLRRHCGAGSSRLSRSMSIESALGLVAL